MKKFFSTLIFSVLFTFAFVGFGYPCFDTFLFIHKKSMVYPTGYVAADVLGEYSINDARSASQDSYFTNYNLYYGLADRFSVQFGVSTVESTREESQNGIDSWSIRGVFNALNVGGGMYFLDLILEHHTGVEADGTVSVFSIPNIFNINNVILVIHPVYEISRTSGTNEYMWGGHGGIFYNVNNRGIIGIGAEYSSTQSSSALNRRLTEGEAAASLFVGFNFGNLYFQNEFAKGLQNSRDYGFAATVKLFLDLGVHI
ncbi:MAG: hypothetical protein N2316_01230 [Spirochaetes bacterium]|nr:hypothetical protein [Spirochaetota bacterium]